MLINEQILNIASNGQGEGERIIKQTSFFIFFS